MLRFSVFILFSLQFSFSQNTLKGVVTDSLQNPLSEATVIATPLDSLQSIKYSITDTNGNYNLQLKPIMYELLINYLGFKEKRVTINAKEVKVKNIILYEDTQQLNEVTINLPVTIKKDTTTYDVSYFTTGKERKLKHILEKLPGIEVEKDGSVYFKGKKIDKTLIENKEFLDGSTKMASNYIPANAIEQLEVIENYAEIDFLKDITNSNRTALNIKLKEDKKELIFGDVELGKGNKKYYKGNSNLFYYAPKNTLNNILNFNNVSEQLLSYNQVSGFLDFEKDIFRKGATLYNDSSIEIDNFITPEDALKSDTKFATLQVANTINNKTDFNSFLIYSDSKKNTLEKAINAYTTSVTENRQNNKNTKDVVVLGKLNANYLPNLKEKWLFKLKFASNNSKNNSNLISNYESKKDTFFIKNKLKEVYINPSIEWHKRKNKNTYSAVLLNYLYKKNTPYSNWKTKDSTIFNFLPLQESETTNINQNIQSDKNKFQVIARKFIALNDYNHLYFKVGNVYFNNTFDSSISQHYDNQSQLLENNEFLNRVSLKFNDVFAGINYKFKTGMVTLNPYLYTHYYNWKVIQETTIRKNKLVFLPGFDATIEFKTSRKLKFSYALKSRFFNAELFSRNFYIESYNSIFKGDENLENEYFHTFNLHFSNFKLYKGLNWYVYANYVNKINALTNAINYQEINLIRESVLYKNANSNLNILGSFSKKIKKVTLNLRGSYKQFINKQLINNNLNKSKNTSLSYNFNVRVNYKKFPKTVLVFEQQLNVFTSNATKFKTIENNLYSSVSYTFFNNFNVNVDYTFENFTNKTISQKNKINRLDVVIDYKNEKHLWGISFRITNLLNTKFIRTTNQNTLFTSDTRNYIFPRVFLLSFTYDL